MNEEKIVQKLIELDEKVSGIPERMNSFESKFDSVLTTLDPQSVILECLDQERVFTNVRIDRLESFVEQIQAQLCPVSV